MSQHYLRNHFLTGSYFLGSSISHQETLSVVVAALQNNVTYNTMSPATSGPHEMSSVSFHFIPDKLMFILLFHI